MYLEDICISNRVEYTKTCECCHLEQKILTQRDEFQEYHTEIYLECQCGNYIEFILPVN